MADGATDLSDLLGSGPVQNPQLPQSTTFAPIVTGGVDPFIAPQVSSSKPPSTTPYFLNTARMAIKNLMTYVGVFVGACVISLSTPRSLILQYIPNTYTSGGVPSYMGVGILGLVATAIAYMVGTLLGALF